MTILDHLPDMTGKRIRKIPPMKDKEFGNLLVLEEVDAWRVWCRCLLCGRERMRDKNRVWRGATTNCGCVRKQPESRRKRDKFVIDTGGETPEERLAILRKRKALHDNGRVECDLRNPVTIYSVRGVRLACDEE